MKTNHFFMFLILMTGLSCSKDVPEPEIKLSVLTELKSEYGLTHKASQERWEDLKAVNGNSYIYQTTSLSLTGHGSTTEIRVEDAAITSRVYVEFETDKINGARKTIFSYNEGANKVGSHTKGALALTIDELYETCAKTYLVADAEKNTIYFETNEEGLMTICGFVPDGCADDCYMGVRINSFDWLK